MGQVGVGQVGMGQVGVGEGVLPSICLESA